MPKLKLIIVTAIALAGLVASLIIRGNNQARLSAVNALLRQQETQLAQLRAERQKLANSAPSATDAPNEDHTAEIERLRGQAGALRKQTNEIARQLQERHRARASQFAADVKAHDAEYYKQLHQLAGGKGQDAMKLGMAIYYYAKDHQGQVPAGLDELAPYLAKSGNSLSGTNQFELVYQGSLDGLEDGIPTATVAILRESQVWTAPDGRMARVYGLGEGGVSEIVTSDDNFVSWEAEHILPPPNPAKAAK